MLKLFPDLLAGYFLFPSGLIYGFYLRLILSSGLENITHWPGFTGVICIVATSIFLTVKKARRKKYSFDHFYVLFFAALCLLICGLFLTNEYSGVAFYFGFMGHAAVHIPAYTYISIRSPHDGNRPLRISMAFSCYFIGIAVGFMKFTGPPTYITSIDIGWTIVISSGVAILGFVINEFFHLICLYNYKKSLDSEWNKYNTQGSLFLSRNQVLLQYQHAYRKQNDVHILLLKTRHKIALFFLFFTVSGTAILYSLLMISLAGFSLFVFTKDVNFVNLPLFLCATGTIVGALLQTFRKPKLIYLVFALIKIAALIAVLGVFNPDRLENTAIFFGIYFTASGVFASIPLHGILEVTPFKYTEVIFGAGYIFEMFLVEIMRYELKREAKSSQNLVLGFGITYCIVTVVCIVLIQLNLPSSKSLISVRNELMGVRRSRAGNTPAPRQYNGRFKFEINKRFERIKLPSRTEGDELYNYGPKTIQVYSIPRIIC